MSSRPDRSSYTNDSNNINTTSHITQAPSDKNDDRKKPQDFHNKSLNQKGSGNQGNDAGSRRWNDRKPHNQSDGGNNVNNGNHSKQANRSENGTYTSGERENDSRHGNSSNKRHAFKRIRERSVSPPPPSSSSSKRRQFAQNQNHSQYDRSPTNSNKVTTSNAKGKVSFSLKDKSNKFNKSHVSFSQNKPSSKNGTAKKAGGTPFSSNGNRKDMMAPTGPRGYQGISRGNNWHDRADDDEGGPGDRKRNRRKLNKNKNPHQNQNQNQAQTQTHKNASLKNYDIPEEESLPSEDEQQQAGVNPITYRATSIYARQLQVGEGTYGKVYKAKNEATGKLVALKRLRLESEREGMPITAVREIKILQSLHHNNIVSLQEMMVEQGNVYMAFQYMDHDLAGILAHPDLTLTPANIKNLFKQMLEGLNYIHKKGILHRDIKCSNVLVSASGTVKLADFGLARKVDLYNPSAHYTNRVITLWYRPPELLLGATNYDGAIDVWGMGCLLLELFQKKAVFQGRDEISQLSAIYSIMGTPQTDSWPEVVTLPWYHLLIPETPIKNNFDSFINDVLPSSDCKELASVLLTLDPKKRLKAFEALRHPYFQNEPRPVPIDLTNIGEWHEFEAKQIRRKEREMLKRQQAEESQDVAAK